ncbi:MAG: metallophosphoesterase [Candidatus Peribacteraceae bacterium]|nr:metallophosphoesterase [Candidatus Peribacteraceae bacterium]
MLLLSSYIFPWDLAILLLIAGSMSVAFLCLRTLQTKKAHNASKLFSLIFGPLSLVCGVLVIYGSFIEPTLFVVSRYEIPFPIHQPLKVAVLSDLHVGPYRTVEQMQRIVNRTNDLLPDIILLPGDFLTDGELRSSELAQLAELKKLKPTLGTYAVLGDHDHDVREGLFSPVTLSPNDPSDYVASTLASFDIKVLRNSSLTANLGTEKILIAGIDDLQAEAANIDKAMAESRPELPTILVSHNPDVILDTLSAKAHLIVAGHTHGGQVRLPFIGPLVPLPTKLGQKYDQGIFSVDDDTTLAISRGIGQSGVRARLFAWPQIMELRLMPNVVGADSSDGFSSSK